MNQVQRIFDVTARILLWVADKIGLTYNEVNILVYYLLIPLSWTVMFDFWLKRPYTTGALALVWMGILSQHDILSESGATGHIRILSIS